MRNASCSIDPSLGGLRGQGSVAPSEAELRLLAPCLRLAPALSGLTALTGTLLGSAPVLLGLALALATCALGPHHPVDLLYVLLGRRLTGGPALPPNPPARRFACALASAWAGGITAFLATGHPVGATALGVAVALTAVVPATSGFCPGAWLWGVVRR